MVGNQILKILFTRIEAMKIKIEHRGIIQCILKEFALKSSKRISK